MSADGGNFWTQSRQKVILCQQRQRLARHRRGKGVGGIAVAVDEKSARRKVTVERSENGLLGERSAERQVPRSDALRQAQKRRPEALGARDEKRAGAAKTDGRITSYNVCYTKLLRYRITQSTGNVLYHKSIYPDKARITSYNVCYTKLLRPH